jgi:hypothetical protein
MSTARSVQTLAIKEAVKQREAELLEELAKTLPVDHQTHNSVAVIATLLLGPRLLSAVSGNYVADQ